MRKSIACVIPVRNSAQTLHRALMSVCTQEDVPDEVVILDDASDDDTPDVARRYAESFPFVRHVRYPEKSPDWRIAACENSLLYTTADYIHSLSASDWIDPHFYLAARACVDAGFVFAEYAIVDKGGTTQAMAICEMLSGSVERPRDALLDQLCRQTFFEGGPACLIRRDAWEWLKSRKFWELKTWQDSVGYSAAAWLYGAAYIPLPCGHFVYDPDGDGEKRKRDPAHAFPMYRKVEKFLDELRYQLPDRLRAALLGKVYATIPRHMRYFELSGVDRTAFPGIPDSPVPILPSDEASSCASPGDRPA